MPHFFVPPENITDNRFVIRGEEARHLITVRRCAAGDEIDIFDGTGRSYRGRVEFVSKDDIAGSILAEAEGVKSAAEINLFQSVPKGERFDWLIEKAAELGVASITPLVSERSVVRDFSAAKAARWERLALAACKQCGRSTLLKMNEPAALGNIKDRLAPGTLTIIPWESEEEKTVGEYFGGDERPRTVNIIIGPEGGFSAHEIGIAKAAGALPVTLGPRILRVETAALVAVVLVMQCAGEFRLK